MGMSWMDISCQDFEKIDEGTVAEAERACIIASRQGQLSYSSSSDGPQTTPDAKKSTSDETSNEELVNRIIPIALICGVLLIIIAVIFLYKNSQRLKNDRNKEERHRKNLKQLKMQQKSSSSHSLRDLVPFAVNAAPPGPPPTLGEWKQLTDPHGQHYWWNTKTGETSWKPPMPSKRPGPSNDDEMSINPGFQHC